MLLNIILKVGPATGESQIILVNNNLETLHQSVWLRTSTSMLVHILLKTHTIFIIKFV